MEYVYDKIIANDFLCRQASASGVASMGRPSKWYCSVLAR